MLEAVARLLFLGCGAIAVGVVAGVLVLSVELIDALNPPHQNSDRFANVGRGL